jgi:hypothetical protein
MPEEPPAKLSQEGIAGMDKEGLIQFIYRNNLVIDNFIAESYNVPPTITPARRLRISEKQFRSAVKSTPIDDLRSAVIDAISKRNNDSVGLEEPALSGGAGSRGPNKFM